MSGNAIWKNQSVCNVRHEGKEVNSHIFHFWVRNPHVSCRNIFPLMFVLTNYTQQFNKTTFFYLFVWMAIQHGLYNGLFQQEILVEFFLQCFRNCLHTNVANSSIQKSCQKLILQPPFDWTSWTRPRPTNDQQTLCAWISSLRDTIKTWFPLEFDEDLAITCSVVAENVCEWLKFLLMFVIQ